MADRFSYSEDFLQKCTTTLEQAFEQVPFYQTWKAFDRGPGVTLDERFDALPTLTKEDMRRHFPTGLMPVSKDLEQGLLSEEIEYTFTSGTTADKVVNIWNQDWWNRSEAASWKLNRTLAALPYPQKQAKLASSLNVGINCEEDLPIDHRILGDTLYLNEKTSILQWQPRHLQRMAAELNAYKPPVLEANPSLLARLAWWALDHGVQIASPAALVFTYEFPSVLHLRAIRQVFSSALVSSYGSTEAGFVMEQCEDGLLHQNTATCRIDFKPLSPQFGLPDVGQIFVTTFDNPWNYLIRFGVGDLIRLHASGQCRCGCGEGMIADAVEGRVGNVTFTTDGALITTKMLDDELAAVAALRDYHFEQNNRKRYLLQVMLAPGADAKAACEELQGALEGLYGTDAHYDIEVSEALLPGPAGKFRRSQTNFTFDEEALFV